MPAGWRPRFDGIGLTLGEVRGKHVPAIQMNQFQVAYVLEVAGKLMAGAIFPNRRCGRQETL